MSKLHDVLFVSDQYDPLQGCPWSHISRKARSLLSIADASQQRLPDTIGVAPRALIRCFFPLKLETKMAPLSRSRENQVTNHNSST